MCVVTLEVCASPHSQSKATAYIQYVCIFIHSTNLSPLNVSTLTRALQRKNLVFTAYTGWLNMCTLIEAQVTRQPNNRTHSLLVLKLAYLLGNT